MTSSKGAEVEFLLGVGRAKDPAFLRSGPSDRFLFAANEDTDTVTVSERDATTGGLAATGGTVRVGSPVCILFKTV